MMAEEGTTAAVETTQAADPMAEAAAPAATETPFNFPAAPEGAKPAEENVASKATNEEEQAETPVVPEKYEFHLPEGLTMTPEIEGQFTEIAKGIGLTQEQADKLVQLHSNIMMDTMRQAEQQKNKWVEACHKEGLSSPEKLTAAKLAVDTFDDTGRLMPMLIESGIAYAPEFQRFLQTIGGYLKEDTAPDSKPAAQAKSAADLLFSNSKY